MSRVELASIRALTFLKDAYTAARRADAIPQLKCIGQACRLYQPDVIRCMNIGGEGTDIDWKCEADLPEALRFGKVDVSCEGWARPGDPYVLKGSCALTYRLVQIPDALRNGKTDSPLHLPSKLQEMDAFEIVFWVVWIAVAILILYAIVSSCFETNTQTVAPPASRPGGPGSGPARGWFPSSNYHDDDAPPPPYSKYGTASQAPGGTGAPGWRPGFWSGAAMGGLAHHLWTNRNRNREQPPEPAARRPWNWEQRFNSQPDLRARPVYDVDDRGEGSSNLGSMRRSTAFASGTNVR